MKIISTNIAEPTTILWRGQEVQTGIYKNPVEVPVYLGLEDVVTDHVMDRRYHGGEDKACYLYSSNHYQFWKELYPDQDWTWGMFGENLTVEGLDESIVRIGDEFKVGDALVRVTQPRQPCYKLGVRFDDQSVVDRFWMNRFPGVYLKVLIPGYVSNGDELTLVSRDDNSLSVADVFLIFRIDRENKMLMQKAIQQPYLASSCRKDIQKILDFMT
jgi:MOSC domain-containing protein YiiM